MFKSAFLISSLVVLFFMSNIYGTSYYVSTSSAGTGTGDSWTNKKMYTSFTWTNLAGGDTVYFDGGTDSLTYSSQILISSVKPASQVVITKGKDANHNGKAIFSSKTTGGNYSTLKLYSCSNIKLTDLVGKWEYVPTDSVTHATYYSCFIINSSTNCSIDNCTITSNGASNNISIVLSTNISVTNCLLNILPNNCIMDNCNISIGYGSGGHTIKGNTMIMGGINSTPHKENIYFGMGEGSTSNLQTTIANNYMLYDSPTAVSAVTAFYYSGCHSNRLLIYNNVIMQTPYQIDGLEITGSSGYHLSVRLYNNTIVSKATIGHSMWLGNYTDTLDMKNNIIMMYNTQNNMLGFSGTGFNAIASKSIDYNQYYSGSRAIYMEDVSSTYSWSTWQGMGYDTHSSTSAANFAKLWGDNVTDYKLAAGSAGIDNGTTVAVSNPSYDGTVRPQGSAYDRGAFEYTTVVSSGTAALVVSPTSLSGFSYTAGSGPSASKYYNLSGSNLSGAPGVITVTGSAHYEVSNNNSTWGSSTTISYSSATLGNTPVYIRLKAGFPAGSYNSENIVNSGGSATNINVLVSGTINPVSTAPSGETLNLTALVEALYAAGGTQMTTSPWVTVELHSASSPYALVDSNSSSLNTAGVGKFTFTKAVDGTNYYIVIKSMNTLETWSAVALSFTSGVLNYNFTTASTQAYTDGSNLPLALHNGKYCLYSGDLNHDGYINSSDYSGVDSDNSSLTYHAINDLNGDGYVTSADYQFIDNNNFLSIHKQVLVP